MSGRQRFYLLDHQYEVLIFWDILLKLRWRITGPLAVKIVLLLIQPAYETAVSGVKPNNVGSDSNTH